MAQVKFVTWLAGLVNKPTPTDTDQMYVGDAGVSKYATWAQVKATLKTYFDTLYPSGSGTSTGTNTGDQNLSGFVPTSRTVNAKVLSADITLNAADVGAPSGSGTSTGTNTGDQNLSGLVPTTRTVNTKALSADITLNAADVGAVSPTSSDTLTNKRVTLRVTNVTSSATPTINTDTLDIFQLTAQAVAVTSFTSGLSGTPTPSQGLIIAITGTASQALTWGTSFEASTVALPTTTSGTAKLTVGFLWNSVTSKWRCVGVA